MGAAGAEDAAAQQQPVLLVGVLDGHGVGGQAASRLAAEGIAAELAQQLDSGSSSGSVDGSGSSGSRGRGSGSSTPASQQALVQAFQRVAARMQADAAFHEGGTAAVVCLVEHGRWVLVAAGWSGLLFAVDLQQPAASAARSSAVCCQHLCVLCNLPLSRSPASRAHGRGTAAPWRA